MRAVSIELDGVRDKNIWQLHKFNSVIFIPCKQKYYCDVLASGEFSKLVYYNNIFVASIACRLEKKERGGVRVYVMTLGVLTPYRGLGIGTMLLDHVSGLCNNQGIGEIYLHVEINNEDAIRFYKKHGFKITEIGEDFYSDCYVCTKYI